MLTRHHGDHFVIYTNIESLCCIPEANIILYVNYISTKMKRLAIPYICKDIEQLQCSYTSGESEN